MRERRYATFMTLLVGVLFVGSLLGNVAFTRHVQQQADARYARLLAAQAAREQQIRDERDQAARVARARGLKFFCDWVYVQIDPALGPPTTLRGEKTLAANRVFYKQIGCKS